MSYGTRKAGSVRFDPYYKVQWWDERSLTWRDHQQAFPTPQVAEAFTDILADAILEGAGTPPTFRVMEITMEGRHPLPSSS
jgi:hypothetical protein